MWILHSRDDHERLQPVLNNPHPSRRQIMEHMDGNLCRCGAHKRIVQAIQVAGKEMGGVQR